MPTATPRCTFLMQRLFPRQATVVSAEAVIQALASDRSCTALAS